ncbi:hypothetical protein SERLA73DRAFT_186466, partial [Serpula lacrymans var. lacrymans S7.3]
MTPIDIPVDHTYTSCYCEENIYLLAKYFLDQPSVKRRWDIFAIFISNATKMVALWNQRKAAFADVAVVWDYHVILAMRPRSPFVSSAGDPAAQTWVYDYDTRLGIPCQWRDYVQGTFLDTPDVPVLYQSLFRVIPGEEFLDHFASDRSHMLSVHPGAEPCYFAEPPVYLPLRGSKATERGVTNNLMSAFVSMARSTD